MLQKLSDALSSKNEQIKNKDIIVIASKVLAYSQGRLVDLETRNSKLETRSKSEIQNSKFKELIQKEADVVLPARSGPGGDEGEMVITMKNKILIPNAGIDNSNVPKGKVVLWPERPFDFAWQIRDSLMKQFKLKKLGVVISDSHCQPLRMGTSGIAIGWAGFYGVQDERGSKDLYRQPMKYTQIAVADNLASAANLEMGETNASIPFVIVRDFKAQFTDEEFSENDYFISSKECIYRGLYKKDFRAQ